MESEKVGLVIKGIEKDIGNFSIRRLLPFIHKQSVGPFVFFDHMGPSEISIEKGMVVRAHPHIGLSTVTYLFDGCIMHRDSLGSKQPIVPGEVNWMTSGRGIVHSERTPTDEVNFQKKVEGLQIWIALPKESEEIEPSFINFASSALPKFSEQGADITLILGEAFGHKSPVPVYSSLFYFDTKLDAEKTFKTKFNPKHEFAVYPVEGELKINGEIVEMYNMVVFKPGDEISITALKNCRFVIIGGEPFNEPRYIWWNFVSSSKERIEKAKQDWKNNSMGQVIDETELIPLPEH